MNKSIECIDCGTEYCPCKLAESGECLVCSQCQGKTFCDCLNWKGVCVYQEFINNGNKAKEARKTYECLVTELIKFSNDLYMIKFRTTHKIALDLAKPGSYVFVRTEKNNYFDIPISVMKSDIENDIVTIMIEIRGIKTSKIRETMVDENIIIRAPYWNGVFGLANINKQKQSKCLILSRGIGIAPMMPVLNKFLKNDCEVKVVVDKSPFDDKILKSILEQFPTKIEESDILEKGKITDYAKIIIKDLLKGGLRHIHVSGADILTYEVINYLHEIGRDDITLSCCNNFKICCGEGICGACTVRYAGHRVRHFCKEQSDPRSIFEGRRFI